MGHGWAPQRRARQASLSHTWKPWERSTGPRTDEGKARTARNAFKGGQWLVIRELTKGMNDLLREQHAECEQVGRLPAS